MVFEEFKKPAFVDLVYGARGTWMGDRPASGEGLVIPKYVPEGRVRAREYPYKVPRQAVKKITPPQSFPGVPREIVFLVDTVNDDRPVLNELEITVSNSINQMRQQIEEAKWLASKERRERRTAEDRTERERSKRDHDRRRRPPKMPDQQQG